MKRKGLKWRKGKEPREMKLLRVKILIKLSHTIRIALFLIPLCFNLTGIEH